MPIVLDLASFVIIFMVILFLVIQVVIPVVCGLPMFPLFRKSAVKQKISEAEKALEEVAQSERLSGIIKEVESRKANLEKKND